MSKQLKLILTGATGMVGEGVLLECLEHESVSEILVVGRRPCGFVHPRLREIIHHDFLNISPIEDLLAGYDACLFCLGTSSAGMREADYFSVTHTLTMHVAGVLARHNPGMVFCYVSGLGTDSTEKGRFMWARVKGKTENDLMALHFARVYAFRPGFMRPTPGMRNAPAAARVIGAFYPVFVRLFPSSVSTLSEVGRAMINAVLYGYDTAHIEVADIRRLSKWDTHGL